MITRTLFAAAALAISCAAPAMADEALAKAKGCTACHALDKKLVGPAYKDVAKKYKGDAKGKDTMVHSILTGSQGKYGPIPMPANKVTEDEAKKLAAWVLTVQ
ncbi:MAG TPA: c-type cytochrome [Usitatibacter sp.]|nr:c-type cytochrome [Usitatibacter sp.]